MAVEPLTKVVDWHGEYRWASVDDGNGRYILDLGRPDLNERLQTFVEKLHIAITNHEAGLLATISQQAKDIEAMGWQPMSSASRTLDDVLVLSKHRDGRPLVCVAHYAEGGGEDQPRFGPAWFSWNGFEFWEIDPQPTHWMPLPKLPTARAAIAAARGEG